MTDKEKEVFKTLEESIEKITYELFKIIPLTKNQEKDYSLHEATIIYSHEIYAILKLVFDPKRVWVLGEVVFLDRKTFNSQRVFTNALHKALKEANKVWQN